MTSDSWSFNFFVSLLFDKILNNYPFPSILCRLLKYFVLFQNFSNLEYLCWSILEYFFLDWFARVLSVANISAYVQWIFHLVLSSRKFTFLVHSEYIWYIRSCEIFPTIHLGVFSLPRIACVPWVATSSANGNSLYL